MEMDPNPPSFNIPMSVQPLDIGRDYTAGMQAGTTAAAPLGQGISAAFDVMNRSRAADDTLKAMNQIGMLSNDAYQAVAGKALGAKETMLGMYASQWLQQQSQNRELQKLGYQGKIETDVAHAKLLDQLAANRVGGTPAKPNVATKAAPAQAVSAPVAAPPNTTGAPTPGLWYGQYPAQAQTQTQAPFTVGAPYGAKDAIPPGAIRATVRDPGSGKALNGFTTLDPSTGRKIFRAMPGQK